MTRWLTAGSRFRKARLGGWFLLLWVSWMLVQGPYIFIRGIGDNLWTPRPFERYERWLFLGRVPTRDLQYAIYARDVPWFDYVGFLMHGFWFGVPWAFGLVLMVYQRKRLLEFLSWQIVLFYLAAFTFMMFPVRPPWMEEGIPRVLMVRNYGGYVDIDNNPAAAFPSLHAALPVMTAMFFFLRCEPRLRFFGVLVGTFGLLVSFSVVYMGEHWVIDVLAGYAAAGLTAWLCMSSRMLRLYARIPGDPVGRLSRLNARICGDEPERADPVEAPDALPRAA